MPPDQVAANGTALAHALLVEEFFEYFRFLLPTTENFEKSLRNFNNL